MNASVCYYETQYVPSASCPEGTQKAETAPPYGQIL